MLASAAAPEIVIARPSVRLYLSVPAVGVGAYPVGSLPQYSGVRANDAACTSRRARFWLATRFSAALKIGNGPSYLPVETPVFGGLSSERGISSAASKPVKVPDCR